MPTRKPNKYGNNPGARRASSYSHNPRNPRTIDSSSLRASEVTSQNEKLQATRLADSIDESMGFLRFEAGKKRVGWLCNMHSTSLGQANVDTFGGGGAGGGSGRAGVDFYFLGDGENGENFKATVQYDPYFLIAVKRGREAEVEEWCKRMFEGLVKAISRVEKEDLQMPNHLLGYRRTFLQLEFENVQDLLAVRKTLLPIAEKNKSNVKAMDTYAEVVNATGGFDIFDEEKLQGDISSRYNGVLEASDFIVDIREYDVPYHVRLAIDKDIRIGKWYTVEAHHGQISLHCIEDRLQRADPVVLAFDIETTKLPLKFPDAAIDQVMMISYMIDGQGFLITNREIVSDDISDFEYTPKPEYDGPFLVFNEPDEKAVLERFFLHIKEARPTVIATYNGDFFDWPFVEARASVLGIDMYMEIGFRKNSEDIYQSDYCTHMDCFSWVNRDSYLPQGSRGLKAVTVAKLGYDPDELDPELMTPYASERPQTLAEYSVSDAVATYYLYMKYVHPFIFSLCTIVPLNPDDTLRKGTGTLCEMLLMVQAYQKQIVLPNKHKDPREAFWQGHLLDSETYVGGHVESIEAGVFRADIPVDFAIEISALDELLNDLDAALKFCITQEEKRPLEDVTNYEVVKSQISQKLLDLRDSPNRNEKPLIYHLDVASMYPNIMTTNRLQPDSMITESDCAACDFNRPGKTCDRRMPWSWRGEFLPAKRDEYNMIRQAASNEIFPGKSRNSPSRTFDELSPDEQAVVVKKRLQEYSKKIYHKIHETKTIEREAIICQRENPFYVDTVRDFRDRRYDFKGQQKVWKGKTEALRSSGASAAEVDEATKMIVLYDSLQLAHKVILNSFYGYVMRKGSRWYSMEMAGVTCLTGAHIIQMARELVERIGRPLELDTDGIWCMLPATFPENVTFNLRNGKKLAVSYPCVMLNHLVHQKFTNHQYQTLADSKSFRYKTHSDNSIFFEVDGPYKAMILPTSKEEDKNLKKRYAVFNHDGSLAELKGFEVKRRGELKLIKIFQTQIFKFFLEGTNLDETYGAVAKVADQWLDVLHSHGVTLADEELIDLICENKSMTKTLEEYGAQKSTSITTARRLADFLGEQMVRDKGLNCKYIISSKPKNTPVTERALPVAIFSAEHDIKRYFLRKWLKDEPGDMDPRSVIDWDYYFERLGSVIQKLITIPAALQKVRNPVPRVAHPDWLQHRITTKDDRFKQKKMTDLFERKALGQLNVNILDHRLPASGDVEDGLSAQMKSKALLQQEGEGGTKTVQKRKSPDPPKVAALDPFAALPAKMPSMDRAYSSWLQYQKQKWKIQKQSRARRRQLFGERPTVTSDPLSNFFRNQAELLFVNTWHVLQLRETSSPGEVRAFVLIGRKIHVLTINVPRQLFLNLRGENLPDVEIEGCEVEKVNHALPNGHPSVHLFRLTMSEATYIQEYGKVLMLSNHPSVEGMYEKHLPLSTRALLKLGSLCSFDESQKGALGRGLEVGFDLSSLLRSPSQEPYLAELSSIGYLFLYQIASGERQILALFSSERHEAHIVVLNRRRDGQGIPNMDKVYGEQLRAKLAEEQGHSWQTVFPLQDKLHFKTSQVTTKRKAYLEVNDVVRKWRREEQKPMLMVVQSPQHRQLVHGVSILREYPILVLRPESSDADLHALGWQAQAAKRAIGHYLTLNLWISHLAEMARYGDIPLCNMPSDDPQFLIDVAYARRLQRSNVVLWWSERPLPDHAGHEKDDIRGPIVDRVNMPQINNAGAYTSVCVDIEVRNLAINTILTSSLINELEGCSDSFSFNPAGPSPLIGETNGGEGGAFASTSAFANAPLLVLREMVKAWWAEACRGNSLADVMVQHLVRWVESPQSFLYDRSLHYYVQTMSKKAFQQLMTDFRRVGSHVVFASSNRLLLQTSKHDVGNAYAYSQYVIKSVQQQTLFHFLDLEVKDYWDVLVWYDPYNYGGKGTSTVEQGTENSSLATIMHWQLSQFLPESLQQDFDHWVVEYIELLHQTKQPELLELESSRGEASRPRMTQVPQFKSLTEDPMSTEITSVLKEPFSKPFTREVSTLIRRQRDELLHPELASDWSFPSLAGGTLGDRDRNPVLELVKAVMQVLSLSKPLQLETRLLRKELLAMFEVREFSAEARYENPSRSLKLEQVSCNSCTMTRDLDLCRDEDIFPFPSSRPATSAERCENQAWRCKACGAEFDRLVLEEMLISRLQGWVLEWQMQDLKCGKCTQLQGDTTAFTEHCTCGGVWEGTVDERTMRNNIDTLRRVAKTYELKMLDAAIVELSDRI